MHMKGISQILKHGFLFTRSVVLAFKNYLNQQGKILGKLKLLLLKNVLFCKSKVQLEKIKCSTGLLEWTKLSFYVNSLR